MQYHQTVRVNHDGEILGAIEAMRQGVFSRDMTPPPETFGTLSARFAETGLRGRSRWRAFMHFAVKKIVRVSR